MQSNDPDTLPDKDSGPDSVNILLGISDTEWTNYTDAMIARDFGVPQSTVQRYRKRHGRPACKYKRIKEPTIRGLHALSRRYTPAMTAEQCAKVVGCDVKMWYYIASKFGIPYKKEDAATLKLNPREEWRGLKNDGTDSLKDLAARGIPKIHNKRYLEQLRQKHDTIAAIAQAEGLSEGQVRSAMEKFGVRISKRLTPIQHTIIGYSKKPSKVLAERYGVSQASISYIRRKIKQPHPNVFRAPRNLNQNEKRVLIALINQASVTELSLGLSLPSGQVRYALSRLAQRGFVKASHWENTIVGGSLAGYWELTETGLAAAFDLLK